MSIPRLARIQVYPIKSLDAVEVKSIEMASHGKLRHDRSFALFEGHGNIIKPKAKPEFHALHADFEMSSMQATLRVHGRQETASFFLGQDLTSMGSWLSSMFDTPIRVQHDEDMGFADDWTAPGPTLVSTATLETIASWFEELTTNDIRQRLRSNLEIDGVPAFWEDRLYGPKEGDFVRFRIGEVELLGKNPCQRCPVPSKDVETGKPTKGFVKRFVSQREASLPAWAHPERFDHFYRCAINTLPGENSGKAELKVGDEVIPFYSSGQPSLFR